MQGYSVEAVLKATGADKFAKAFQNATKSAEGLDRVSGKMKSVGKRMTTAVTLPIVGMGAAIMTVGARFDDQMSTVQAVTGATGKEMDSMRKLAMDLGKSTRFSASEAAEGMEMLGRAGFKTGEIVDALPSVLTLASAGAVDLGDAADITSNILSGFGMKAQETARVADILAKASADSNTDVKGLGEAFKYVGPVASSLGVSIEDTAASIGILGDAGIQGGQAGRMLRSGLQSLASPTSQASKLMSDLGIEVFDAEGNMKSMPEVIKELEGGLEGMTAQQKAAALETLFGADAMSAWSILVEEGSDEVGKFSEELRNSEGTAKDMSETMENNLAGAGRSLMSALEGLALSFYELGAGPMTAIVNKITELVNWFTNLSDRTKQWIVIIALAAVAIGPLIWGIGQVIAVVRNLMIVFRTLGIAIGLLTSPIGLIVAAIIAAAALIYIYWEPIKEFFINLWEDIKETGIFIWEVLKEIWSVTVEFLKGLWEGITEFFSALWEGIKEIFMMIWEPIKEAWNETVEIFTGLWEGAVETFLNLWDGVLGFFTGIWEGIKAVVQGVVDFIIGLWESFIGFFEGIWDGVKSSTEGAWNLVKGIVSGVVGAIAGVVGTVVGGIVSTVQGAWNGIKSVTSTVWNGVKSLTSTVWNGVKGTISTVTNGVKNAATKAWNSVKNVTSTAWNNVKDFTTQAWDNVKSKVSDVVGNVKQKASEAWNNVKNKTSEAWNNVKSKTTEAWDNVKSKVSGVASSVWSSVTGAWDNVKSKTTETWNNAKEKVTEAATNIRDKASEMFEDMKNKVRDKMRDTKDAVSKGMSSSLSAVKDKAGDFLQAGKNVASNIASGIRAGVGKVAEAAKGLASKIRGFLPFSPAKEGPLRDIMKIRISESIAEAIKNGEGSVVKAISDIADEIIRIADNLPLVVKEIETMTISIINHLKRFNKDSKKQFNELYKTWITNAKNLIIDMRITLSEMYQVGVYAMQGLANGLESMRGSLMAKAQSIANAIRATIQSAFDIHSPSRWMRDFIGKNMMLGWIDGMESMKSKILAVTKKVSEWMRVEGSWTGVDLPDEPRMASFRGRISDNGQSDGRGGNIVQNITINSPKPTSPSENARKMKQASRALAMEWGV